MKTRHVTIESDSKVDRLDEIKAYYEGSAMKLEQVYNEAKNWFIRPEFKVGRGGSHVWVAKNDKRVLIVT